MRHHQIHRIYAGLFVFLCLATSLIAVVLPTNAQDGNFATNTPVSNTDGGNATDSGSSPMIFATNTPDGMVSDSGSNSPEAPLFNYGMRIWLEDDFVEMVLNQSSMLEAGDENTQFAVNLLLYEMEQRFPSAPTDPVKRQELIAALISAPVGSLDMRQILRPFIQETIDSNPGEFLIEANGFSISLTPANLDGTGELDRVVEVLYERDGVVRYKEYLLATANDSGSYTLLTTTYDLPAAPHGGVNDVMIEHMRDVNADTLDELVLRVDDGMASDRFYIIEARNGRAVDLVDPEAVLRVGEVINWSLDTATGSAPDLVVYEYQTVSEYPDWVCINQKEYTWVFERNLYRQTQDLNAQFTNIDSLGCTLGAIDLFSLPVSEAITTVEAALLEYGFDAPDSNRALMTLAMLYVLTGRLDDARNTAGSIITVDDDTTWESRQANALIRATNAAGNTALDICEAVAIASEYPACDVNAVIGTYLDLIELSTEEDLIEQLESAGLPVLESVVISEIGRADRIVVLFSVFDSEWWGFYEGSGDTYNHEPANAPTGFEEASFPLALVEAPQSAIDALLVDDNPARVLTILENLVSENPDTPLTPSALYMQALAYEFTGDRDSAREIYYTLWEIYPDEIWGIISAEHLELR